MLSDETRLRILIELQNGPRNVSTLVRKLKSPQPTVSHHLALLRGEELVVTRRDGKEIIYSLDGDSIPSERALRALLKDATGLRLGRLVLGLRKS